MVFREEQEIERVKGGIQEKLAERRELKLALAKNDEDMRALEGYLAYLLGKPVSEISVVKSIPQNLAGILRNKGHPMRAKELLTELRRIPGLENTAMQTLTGALIRYVNKGKKFQRVAPNTYWVLEEGEKPE